MSDVQVRVPRNLARELLDQVNRPGPRESVVFGLAAYAATSLRELILIRTLIIPPESAFLSTGGHGARWSGAYTVELLNRALESQSGLFVFHAHPGARQVSMSEDDRNSARELLPKFQLVLPRHPHGSIVIGAESAAGQLLMPNRDEIVESFSFRIIENRGMCTWPLPETTRDEYRVYRQQRLVDTRFLRKLLGQIVVAVVGLSGGGSQVVLHLAALGVGEIVGIDNQRTDAGNRLASPHLGWLDALFNVHKTSAAKWRMRTVNHETKFTGIRARVPEAAALDALKRADIIVGCVNNLHGRADINEIAWRYCIPYVDIGLALITAAAASEEPPPLSAIPGNVFTALPGGPCLWCAEFLTQSKLERETNDRGRAYLQDKSGNDAFVAPFNGTLASEAVAEVLRLVTGLRHSSDARRQYDGLAGTLTEVSVLRKSSCLLCGSVLAAGDPVWQPIRHVERGYAA